MPTPTLPSGCEVFVPDGSDAETALSRTTEVAVVAHPDDAEMVGLPAIGGCRGSAERWFTAVVCTDGARIPQAGPLAGSSPDEVAAVRGAEQRRAAQIGGYAAVVQLGFSSEAVRSAGRGRLVDDLRLVLSMVGPEVLYTHNPADKHRTHVAVAAASLEAVSTLTAHERPGAMYGVEVWGALDWLPDDEKVRFDVSAHTALSRELIGCFQSQIAGGKRYDLAVEARRRANATLDDPTRRDTGSEVVLAMDMSPLMEAGSDHLGPFLERKLQRFREEVIGRL